MTTPLASPRSRLAALALALAVAFVPLTAGTADAAYKPHHRHGVVTKKQKAVTAKRAAAKPAAIPAPAAVPAPAAAPAPASVISIGGFVFYGLTYEQAVAAYQAAVAAGGPPPPPVTSVSVTTTVGGTA